MRRELEGGPVDIERVKLVPAIEHCLDFAPHILYRNKSQSRVLGTFFFRVLGVSQTRARELGRKGCLAEFRRVLGSFNAEEALT